MTQMSVLQSGAALNYPGAQVLDKTEAQYRIPEFRAGVEWPALKRLAFRHGHVV